MNKALRTTLVLAILISAAANAPGLLLALGNSEKADPAKAKAGSTVAPVDYYAYDYDYDTVQSDPGEWLDSLFRTDNGASVASWHHTWTDFESKPAADALGVYGRPAHWEPEGVLFAYLATFSDIGYTDLRENPARPGSARLTGMRFAALAGGGGPRGPGDEPGPGGDDPGPGPGPDDVPNTDPPPPEDETPVPPGPDTDPLPPGPDTDPTPPVSVPEPESMGLFALGLAGLFMWGKRYRVAVVARNGRDRA